MLSLCVVVTESTLALDSATGRTQLETDCKQLLAGVSEVSISGSPGVICVFGPDAFPLLAGRNGENSFAPVAAAARMGKGRIVAFSHDGFFSNAGNKSDLGKLLFNSIRWAGSSQAAAVNSPRVLVYGFNTLADYLKTQGFGVVLATSKSWRDQLGDCQVFCVDTRLNDDKAMLEAVHSFIMNGGGLVTAGTGWAWAQHGGTLKNDYLGNKLMAPAGLVVSGETTGFTAKDGYAVETPPSPLVNAQMALDFLLGPPPDAPKDDRKRKAQAAYTLEMAVRAVPVGDKLLMPRLEGIRESINPVPAPKKPVRVSDGLARLVVVLAQMEMEALPPELIKTHPASAVFPGSVPTNAPRVTKMLQIDTVVPGWHSTGLYAAPGEVITVTVPAAAVGRDLGLQIGCHSDQLWRLDRWERWPELCTRVKMGNTETRLASGFGGPIYIDVPERCSLGMITMHVMNAVEAPYYVLGKTTLGEWRDRIRNLPGPWAELESRGIILSVPSSGALRSLDDPETLMKFWNRAVDLEDELAAWKPGDRKRPERFVADVQISAGYMHSGYPIMCLSDMFERNLSIKSLVGVIPDGLGSWGHWHELGHNHQAREWTPEGAGEVTVNLFTLYVSEMLCGAPIEKSRMKKQNRIKSMREYFSSDRTPANWDPFEGLVPYCELVDGFGWEALKRVFAEYRNLRRDELPRSNVEEWDQWMVRYSKTVGRNLGPFFVRWRIPVTGAALNSITNFPAWMHSDFDEAASNSPVAAKEK